MPAPPEPEPTPPEVLAPAPTEVSDEAVDGGSDAGPRAPCTFELATPARTIEAVSSRWIAKAVIPSLDPEIMKAKVESSWDATSELRDCQGDLIPADWNDWAPLDAGVPSPGTVKLLHRQSLPAGRQAVWIATARAAPGACVEQDGYGLLAIVEVEGKRLTVLGVSPWRPRCFGKRSLRVEALGGETVYVEPERFSTGCGTSDSERFWSLRGNHLRVEGRYVTGRGGGGDCGPAEVDDFQESSTARYSGNEIVLQGQTVWHKSEDGGSGSTEGRSSWQEHYTLRDGKLVQEPPQAGAAPRDPYRRVAPP
jgi:hypothetical protein